MTTGNRLDFRVKDLRKNIEDRYVRNVAEAEATLAEHLNIDKRIADWRAEQEKRVRALAAALRKGTLADDQLAEFSIKSKPSVGWRVEDTHQRSIEEATLRRDRAIRRLDAIRAHTPEGETEPVLSLTPRMATDWFGI